MRKYDYWVYVYWMKKITLIIIQFSLFFSILLLCNRFKHSGTYFTLCQRRGHSFISQFSHQLGQWNVWCRIGYSSQSSKYYVEWRTGPNWIYFFGQNGYSNAGKLDWLIIKALKSNPLTICFFYYFYCPPCVGRLGKSVSSCLRTQHSHVLGEYSIVDY